MTTIYSQRTSVPSAFITKGKQRLKQYNDAVYLKDGEEFQIELFNPTQEKVLAKILVNGKLTSDSGIILRPGERVFLERYLDEPKKFRFDTYNVDQNDSDSMRAIENNGVVEVQFFEEYKIVYYDYTTTYQQYPQQPRIIYTDNTGCPGFNGPSGTGGQSSSVSDTFLARDVNASYALKFILNMEPETGRVEKGSRSGQDFQYASGDFSFFYTWKSTWKILPRSSKPITKEDLKVFCGNCGAKRKKDSHNFCPHCGSRY